MKNQEKMKIRLEEKITDKMKRKKMYKNLQRIRKEEAPRIQIKNKKKIAFMIGKYGKREEIENEEVKQIMKKYKMMKYLDNEFKPIEEVQEYGVLIIETGNEEIKIILSEEEKEALNLQPNIMLLEKLKEEELDIELAVMATK